MLGYKVCRISLRVDQPEHRNPSIFTMGSSSCFGGSCDSSTSSSSSVDDASSLIKEDCPEGQANLLPDVLAVAAAADRLLGEPVVDLSAGCSAA